MTKGDETGTSGWSWLRTPVLIIAGVGFINTLVNASSLIIEARRDGDVLNPAVPFFLEVSSFLVILSLAPFIGRAIRRWPIREEGLPRSLAVHAALTVPFSLAHVALMVAVRETGYRLAGGRYGFFEDGVLLPLVYEWRKDAVTYAILAAIFWYFERFNEKPAPVTPQRIELRDGATASYLDPSEIIFVASAGNYVEFHTSRKTHLIRGTLSAWEKVLAPFGFARIHRSRLVNPARISLCKPTPSGDIEIIFDDGSSAPGSRRYRDRLTASLFPARD